MARHKTPASPDALDEAPQTAANEAKKPDDASEANKPNEAGEAAQTHAVADDQSHAQDNESQVQAKVSEPAEHEQPGDSAEKPAYREVYFIPPPPDNKLKQVGVTIGISIVLIVCIVVGTLAWAQSKLNMVATLEPPFAQVDAFVDGNRPADQSGEVFAVLSGPTELSQDPASWQENAKEIDTFLLMRVAPEGIESILFPSDSWLDIPGYSFGTLYDAYAFGGAALVIATLEQATGMHVDHLALTSTTGLIAASDAAGGVMLGGVAVSGKDAAEKTGEKPRGAKRGLEWLNGQQEWIGAIFDALLDGQAFDSMYKLLGFHNKMQSYLAVDSDVSMIEVNRIYQMLRGLDSSQIDLQIAPNMGVESTLGGSQAVLIDDAALKAAFAR
ncbi:MAG: LCP family protein [Arcanobacterium sp.]|nr:LCP family protein [Arcanobacterium sp.]